VTLGFSSVLEANDVLHVVCATSVEDEDRREGTVDLYLERFDQAYSCHGGADEVLVGFASIEVKLNEKGREALGFDGGVSFRVPAGLDKYQDALAILRQMSGLECGKRIRVDIAAGPSF
jgi:hypothetical protein